MHIEHLSKSQIVLLTLLVSFVTSIATGIVTVSLMDQAPPVVAQTVNRVIERTVEKVTPAVGQTATVITREKTVVVKESELISQAVERSTPALARLFDGGGESPTFLGLGVVLDAAGTIATDSGALDERSDAMIALSDGSHVRAFVVARNADSGVAFLKAATTTSDGKTASFNSAVLSGSRPVLGQTVISLAGKADTRIGNGIVTAIVQGKDEKSATIMDTTILSDAISKGSLLVNTEGQIMGLSTFVSRREGTSSFIVPSVLTK